MSENNNPPRLVVIVRTDLQSLNPGKGMAQACHAANEMVWRIRSGDLPMIASEWLRQWEAESGRGFGTTIVLGANEAQMRKRVDIARRLNLIAGVVVDDTYPLQDGGVTHLIPLATCAYIFGPTEDTRLATYGLDLHP